MGSFSEMFFLFLLALIIFGPKKLPEIARQVGKTLAEFRRASNEFKSQLDGELRQMEIEEALKKQDAERAAQILPPHAGSVASGTLTGEASPAPIVTPTGETGASPDAPGHHD